MICNVENKVFTYLLPDNVIERISVSKMEEYLGLLGYIIKNKKTNDNNKKLKLFPLKGF